MRKLLLLVATAISLSGCVYRTHFSPEYRTHYVLAKDTEARRCKVFTGIYSVWFGGLREVPCLGKPSLSGQEAAILKRGTPVRIKRLYSVAAIDAYYRYAIIEVTLPGSAARQEAYAEWPAIKASLAQAPDR